MAFSPPVSAMKGMIGPWPGGQRPVDRQAVSVPAGEGDACAAGIVHQGLADGAPLPRQQVQEVGGSPRLMEQPHGGGGDQRRLLGRLGEHGVAGGQRGGDLAGEDRQREVPRG
jgi:hypothetical protein